MPRVSKKTAVARKNWGSAVKFIKLGTKRGLAILTPRKKKRKTEIECICITQTQTRSYPDDPDDDFFLSPGRSIARGFDDLPEARSQFGLFSTNTRLSPSKSSSLGRFWSDFTPRLLDKFSPSRKSTTPRVFDDDESILAHRSPRPARMFDDTSSSDSDSLDFRFTPGAKNDSTDFASSINHQASVDSASLDSASSHDNPAYADTDGRLREAPTIEAARAALADIGKVLRPPRKKGPGYIDPHLDPFTESRIKGIQSLLALYTLTRCPSGCDI
ncbi:hypothetical protein B0H13DRAFT_2325570 [Mycena leptocephala]|nr:hypothetical protein B0H13DRAFT_2325570 [Mycena leptocephala]